MLTVLAALAIQGVQPTLRREFRAAWVATVANIDWPSKPGLSTEQQQRELTAIMDAAAAMNLNAIVLQVRPAADALYDSPYEPWSEYLTGAQGRKPSPFWDPLTEAVEMAHQRGMELHCWFNPYRALHSSQKSPVASSHISKTNPTVVKKYGNQMWMDPGEPEVQRRSLAVILDVVRRYDIDGVHLDDYFYPYRVKDSSGKYQDFPDGPSWKRYVSSGGKLKRADWRRKNVDDFIHNLYLGIHRVKPWVKFGISPFGIYRPGYPPSIKAGVDQYADLYADARKWLAEGWVDYYTPQLYWPIKQKAQSYPVLLKWWMENNPKNRHMWPGNFTSKTNPNDGNWAASEIVAQIAETRKLGAGGNVHFSMKALTKNWNGVRDALVSGPYSEKALVPASPWLDRVAPNSPKVISRKLSDDAWQISWTPDRDTDIRFYVAATRIEGKWKTTAITSEDHIEVRGEPVSLSVVAIDRAGNASSATAIKLQ
jgi:uncharacterized lipoprotein YddW (UPF0748 family)